MPNKTEKLFLKIKIQKIQNLDILIRYGNWDLIGIKFLHILIHQSHLRHMEFHLNTSRTYQIPLLIFTSFSVSRAEILAWGMVDLVYENGEQIHVIVYHVTAFLSPR